MDSDPVDRDGIQRVLAAAANVMRQHAPDADGWCRGYLTQWGRLAPFPCQTARWAAAVSAIYTDSPD